MSELVESKTGARWRSRAHRGDEKAVGQKRMVGGHGKVGLVGETWKRTGVVGQREERQQARSSHRSTHPYLDHAVTVGIGDVRL